LESTDGAEFVMCPRPSSLHTTTPVLSYRMLTALPIELRDVTFPR
jgi:hypothetical protein